MGKIFNEPIAV